MEFMTMFELNMTLDKIFMIISQNDSIIENYPKQN